MKNSRMVCTHPDLLTRICKLVERKNTGLICFPIICFPRLIYCDQEPLLLLNVTEDYFLGVHIRLYQLDTRFVLGASLIYTFLLDKLGFKGIFIYLVDICTF